MSGRAGVGVSDYRVFGLKIRSELELPELFVDETEATPEVLIRRGTVPGKRAAGLHADKDSLVLVVPDVGRFRIAEGTSITVEPEPGVPERNVRLFLLGSAFGALLHQRGLLPLHANAVEIDGKAVAFMGESGSGKSTLAAWFHDHGCRVLADDVCVVRFDATGRAMACAGLPRLRLWVDAMELTGRDRDGLHRSYVGEAGDLDKFDVPVELSAMMPGDAVLGAVYLLDDGEEFAIEPLAGVEAADAIFANTYRGAYVAATGTHRDHWHAAMTLARRTPVFRVMRTKSFGEFPAECEALLRHASESASGS
jgi:hypothetical protein